MGFKINQTIQTINHGELTSFYVRIEEYAISKSMGTIRATVVLYPDSESAKLSFPKYIGDHPDSYLPSPIATKITYNGIEMEYPTLFTFEITTSVDLDIPIFETLQIPQTITYLDFDADGNIIEATKIEYTDIKTQTGISTVTKKYMDVGKIIGNVYEYFYPLVMVEYGKIFGIENIIKE